ncbi:Maf1 regulator-domain-containing protein [Durotheca rogersii]|uniref:Maf1 regulator-domain-containing protein n=1 Tax=Durotheca rogersii TaxID=419775 RepID=UPI00221F6845|nr:Maf1 regulator-domain-containing protein [Durotheca rogersii]KAI5860060.1 Maf1 regulator-domain-containing protein [Durotheca rogersii]
MAINYLILLSRQGKVRLAKWFTTLSPKDKAKIVKDVSQLVLARRTRMCNFLEYKDTKIVYRRYASLFFIAGCSSDDNELITLEIIHRYVEQMDKYYGNVCELDIIFSFTKAYYILDEILLAGELQESSKKNVLRCIGQQDSLEDMEFLPLRDFDVITSSLNFSTAECRVKGGCDLYTTKAAGSDKKLYKTIETNLESQHAALIKFGASLSPPQRKEMAASLNLSRSSPFGPLSEISSRRTFAYLIATLNASHPDYDFSHVLRPTDFRRERDLRKVMANIDSTLNSVRPLGTSLLSPNPVSSYRAYGSPPSANAVVGDAALSSPPWGPHMWTMIDKEMTLKDCTAFSYQPIEDPFDGDESAIWRMHYFFFNKNKKRVAYLYVRGLPIVVSSPALAPHHLRRGSSGGLSKRHAAPLPGSLGANKRAKFWLGDQLADRIIPDDDEYYDDDDDVVLWDPEDDVEIDPLNDPSTEEEEEEDSEQYDDGYGDDDDDEGEDEERTAHSVRGVSEDIAARMEM